MKNKNPSKHEQVVSAVERSLRQRVASIFGKWAKDPCLKLWRDFAARTDLGKTRKPMTWVAALVYTYDQMCVGGFSQAEVAKTFGVSPLTLSQKYRQIAGELQLKVLDKRYIPEGIRVQIQLEEGPLPEGLSLLERPSWSRWIPPLGTETEGESGPQRSAQDLVYDGWEALDELTGPGDPELAERHFREALKLDPTLADAYNGLAQIAEREGDLRAAEEHYRQAYKVAREALGSESPRAYDWWLDLETRPYMRARHGLGWVYWQTGRLPEAIAEYEALLRLNKNDNQGARYIIGPFYQLAGDNKSALQAYKRFRKDYPEDEGDPHHSFCWGLALYEAGDRQGAVAKWRKAFFENIYIAPLLLAEPLPPDDIWLTTNLMWPDYAREYIGLYGELWTQSPQGLACLRRLWDDPQMRTDVARWLEIGRQLKELSGTVRARESKKAENRWRQLIAEREAIEERAPSQELLHRVVREV
jgi:tetratricopeptide (TPR) repeat protein